MDFTQISSMEVPIDMIIRLIFFCVLGAYAIFSGILYYHWNSYGTDLQVMTTTFLVYFFTTIPLFVIMGIIAINI
jgi:hypothetical protein